MCATLAVPADGTPGLALCGKDGQGGAVLHMSPDGSTRLYLLDKDQHLRALLGSTELTMPLTGSTEVRPESSLVLFDKDGKVIWSAP